MSSGTRFQEALVAGKSSAAATYRDLVVGDGVSWGRVLWFEVVTGLAAGFPGALGLALRRLLYPSLLAGCGRGVVLGRGLILRHPGRIRLAARVLMDDDCVLDAKGAADGIEIGEGALLSRGTVLACKGGGIRIGARANFGVRCVVSSVGGVEIGEAALLAGGCYVGGGRYHVEDREQSIAAQGSYSRGSVVIGEHAWLGAHAVVLDGVRIGKGAVVAAGAVVTHDVADHAVVAGVPARTLR